MMTITIGKKEYELKTSLSVAVALEKKAGKPLMQIAASLNDAEVEELLDVIKTAADTEDRQSIGADALECWGLYNAQLAANELLTRLVFSGTTDQIEKNIEKYPVSEAQKNVIRETLGLPTKELETA